MDLNEAKDLLQQYGFKLVEAYGDASPAQMADMKKRLTDYIDCGAEFKIKSKANPLGLVVTVEKLDDNDLLLRNANTWTALARATSVDDMIKKIYDIQANLGNIQKRETFELDLLGNVIERLNRGQLVVLPDELFNDSYKKYKSLGDMVYLHGQAEEDAGFDICKVLNKTGTPLTKSQRYDCVIANPDKGFVPAYLYFWHDAKFMSKDFPLGMPRGLICYKTDKEYCDDAQEKLDSMAERL